MAAKVVICIPSMDTVPAHLLPLAMEEFPQSLATACVCRAGQREPRLRCVECGIIEEEDEDCSTLEEDQAQRSFLQTLESLRRNGNYIPNPKQTLLIKNNCESTSTNSLQCKSLSLTVLI
uniref:Uncharacterized protein n=1 Tax=Xiphophorus maculatus TaxID=8083 RepID=A0A3B5Q0C4_XIPMA